MNINTQDIINHINSGAADADISRILAAVTSRRSIKADTMFYSLKPGQQVWFNDRVRPAYMRGRSAVIVAVNRTRVEMKMVKPRIGERFQGVFNCAPELFDVEKPSFAVE